ncbi:NAD(P)H-binding protein [Streptomyces sp. NPDC052693]|uniref:NAD(P)H-binding protein n=1 Tax=Streptomyces sp. NPDC052693 TaxID=3155814 RepID=UPI003445F6E9
MSVFPKAWRERNLGRRLRPLHRREEVRRHHTRSGLDWVILRPAALLDVPGRRTVALGPAETQEKSPGRMWP